MILSCVLSRKVRKLTGVWCDPDRALPDLLPLLWRVTPYLEELEITNARLAHLEAIGDMPALRVLSVDCEHQERHNMCTAVPALPSQLEELRLGPAMRPHYQLLLLRGLAALPKLRKLRVEGPILDGSALCLPPQLEVIQLAVASLADLRTVHSMPALRR